MFSIHEQCIHFIFSASPTIDEHDEVQRAKEERREIVAKYDKVNEHQEGGGRFLFFFWKGGVGEIILNFMMLCSTIYIL